MCKCDEKTKFFFIHPCQFCWVRDSIPSVDSCALQKYLLLVTSFCGFTCSADTGDSVMDMQLQDNGIPTNIIWSIHDTTPATVDSVLGVHNTVQRGVALLNLFNGAEVPLPSQPPPSLSPSPPLSPPPSPMPPAPPVDPDATSWCEPGQTFCFEWFVLGENIQITMIGTTSGYVSIGFGDGYGTMAPADVIAGWLDAGGNAVISDRRNLNGWEAPVVDPVQSASAVRGSYVDGKLSVAFTRKLG